MFKRSLIAFSVLTVIFLVIYLITHNHWFVGLGAFIVMFIANFIYQFRKTGKVKFL